MTHDINKIKTKIPRSIKKKLICIIANMQRLILKEGTSATRVQVRFVKKKNTFSVESNQYKNHVRERRMTT